MKERGVGIKHPESRVVRRREDYLEICDRNDCAAQLLSLLEEWTSERIESLKTPQVYEVAMPTSRLLELGGGLNLKASLWLYRTNDDFREALLYGFGEKSIRSAIKLLKKKGFISVKPCPKAWDNTLMYLFNIEQVQMALNEWAVSGARSVPERERMSILVGTDLIEPTREARKRGLGVVTDAFVYLMQAEGTNLYKIGMSVNPSERLKNLQCQCPYKLKLICSCESERAFELEQGLHQRYLDFRVSGEWFEFSPLEVDEVMAALTQTPENALLPISETRNAHLENRFYTKGKNQMGSEIEVCDLTLSVGSGVDGSVSSSISSDEGVAS